MAKIKQSLHNLKWSKWVFTKMTDNLSSDKEITAEFPSV